MKVDLQCYDCNGHGLRYNSDTPKGAECAACEGVGTLDVCTRCNKHLLQYGARFCNWCINDAVRNML